MIVLCTIMHAAGDAHTDAQCHVHQNACTHDHLNNAF
jgi:hypothetical protein